MGSEGSPNSYAPNQYVFDINRNCSPEICSRSCPPWCPFAFSPPTALNDDDDSNFSPFIIALIAVLATGLLFIIYYTLISRYCKRRRRSRTRPTTTTTSSSSIAAADQNPIAQFERNLNIDQLQLGRSSGGLDDGLIKSITVFKYRRGDGLIESTECAVCLNEFKEDENLRLLPNCSHAFHIPCIDAWLKSHPNCPLCRANGNPFLPTWASTSVPDSARDVPFFHGGPKPNEEKTKKRTMRHSASECCKNTRRRIVKELHESAVFQCFLHQPD